MKRRILYTFIVVVLIVGASSGIYAYLHFPSGSNGGSGNICQGLSQNTAPGFAASSNSSSSVVFTIIESDLGSPYAGMNGSYFHLTVQWPVMVVYKGQSVTIHVYNCASAEPHGFEIAHYFNQGVTVHSGQSAVVSFVANQVGNFTVFCNVPCSIHPYMQNGVLSVVS